MVLVCKCGFTGDDTPRCTFPAYVHGEKLYNDIKGENAYCGGEVENNGYQKVATRYGKSTTRKRYSSKLG